MALQDLTGFPAITWQEVKENLHLLEYSLGVSVFAFMLNVQVVIINEMQKEIDAQLRQPRLTEMQASWLENDKDNLDWNAIAGFGVIGLSFLVAADSICRMKSEGKKA